METAIYISKVQVKNFVTKTLGKRYISQSIKGRICSHSTSGYYFDNMADGFVEVNYRAVSYHHSTMPQAAAERAEAMANVEAAFLAAGFEKIVEQRFTGWNENHTERRYREVVGFRKAR